MNRLDVLLLSATSVAAADVIRLALLRLLEML
jgi:hypothetical protein